MGRLGLRNLEISMAGQPLLRPFSHHFEATEIVSIVGRNGSGKTTLLKTIAKILAPPEGSIFINGHDIVEMPNAVRSKLLSLLPQTSPLQSFCLAKTRIAHGLMPGFGFDHIIDNKETRLVHQIAERLRITHLLEKPLGKMSGGEQRLVHIAKCLVNPALDILLLDEPSVFLDFSQKQVLARILKDYAKKKCLIIFSSHDGDFIRQCSTKTLKIENKKVIETKNFLLSIS